MAALSTTETVPSTLAAFVRLCEAHGDAIVTRADSLKSGNCKGDTDRFIKRYLEGRTEVPLRDLIPFIRRGHDYWGEVVSVIETALIRLKVLKDNAELPTAFSQISEPSRKRTVDLD
jgi:hypothetical protein